ncbi:MFS transporter [Streptomyces sp. URMC 123]|uniref:MFS transporter n=1 Tax=Streptomyces sp. URMC 123 TaxID=3423403 RepID=UPI003F1E3585
MTPPRRRLLGPTYTIAVICAGSSLPTSLYAEYGRRFELSPFTITALFAVYVTAIIPTMLLCGGLSDTWGRRRTARCGLALSALAAVVFATAPGAWALFAGRLLQGAAAGLTTGAATAALADGPDPAAPRRARAISLASFGISIGSACGPLLSGLITAAVPGTPALPFLAHLALLLPAALLSWPAAGAVAGGARWRPRWPTIPQAAGRAFALAASTTVFSWSLLGLFLALIPSVAEELGSTTSTAVGGGTVAVMLACSALPLRYAERLTRGRGQLLGLLAMAAGLALVTLAAAAHSLPLLLAAAIASGAGQGIAFTGALADLSEVTPTAVRGEVFSAAYVVGYLALSVPVLAVGALASRTGMVPAVFWFGAITAPGCLIASTVLVLVRRGGPRPRLRRPAPQDAPVPPPDQPASRSPVDGR